MASVLFRTLARRGSAFRRIISDAAAPSGGEGFAVRRDVSPPPSRLRRFTHTGDQVDQPPKSREEKVDQMQQQIKEFDRQFEENLIEVLKWHKEALRTADCDGCFGRLLAAFGMTKDKYGDDFIWRCELATLFVLSAGVGYLLPFVKIS